MKAIKWTPIPFIEETRSLCHSTDKPFPRQELNMINHLFYVYLFVIKDTLVLILPQNLFVAKSLPVPTAETS